MNYNSKKQIAEKQCHKVTKSNEIIRKVRSGMTLQEQKIIAFLISQIQITEENPYKYYLFDTKYFCNVCHIDEKNYINIRRILKKLYDRESIEIYEDGCYCPVKWLGDYKIEPDASKVSVQLHFRLVPYLIELKKNFTSYYLGDIVDLKNKYSILLYELFASYAYIGTFDITVEELKNILNIDGYDDLKIFKRDILNKSVKEISEKTNLRITIEDLRQGRKITAFRVHINDVNK